MTTRAAARRDVEGGLEVHKTRTGWQISRAADLAWRPEGGDDPGLLRLPLPTRREARAVRALLLAHIPDWDTLAPGENGARFHPPTPQAGAAATRVVAMVDAVAARRLRGGVCLGCGCRPSGCACGTGGHAGGSHYTAADLAWVHRPARVGSSPA